MGSDKISSILCKKTVFYRNVFLRIAYLSIIMDVVLRKSRSQAKHTAAHVLPGQKMQTASFA